MSGVTMSAIELIGLNKSYVVGFRRKKVHAVHDLSLSIQEGEVFGIIGPNGAGKTTTIKMMLGLTHPTSGSVRIFGEGGNSAASRAQIGFLPERPYFYQYLTGGEFLDFYGQLFELPSAVRQTRAKALLERVGMAEHEDTPLHKFSKGMLQRMGMAQALINDPKLVILDEPMSGLDPLGRRLIRDIILDLKAEGRTIVFSSHILSDVELICDRVGIITRGRLDDVGTLDQLVQSRVRDTEITVIATREQLPEGVANRADALTSVRDRLLITVTDEAAKVQILTQLLSANIPIHAVTPRHDTLEDIFLDRIQRSQPGGGAA